MIDQTNLQSLRSPCQESRCTAGRQRKQEKVSKAGGRRRYMYVSMKLEKCRDYPAISSCGINLRVPSRVSGDAAGITSVRTSAHHSMPTLPSRSCLLGHGSYVLLVCLVPTSSGGQWRGEELEDEARGCRPWRGRGTGRYVCGMGISRAAEQREGREQNTSLCCSA